MFKKLHAAGCIIPEEGGVYKPTIFFDVEGVASAFFFADDKVVFAKFEMGDGGLEHGGGPSENRFGIGGEFMDRFVTDESYKDGLFIDDDGSASAKSADERDGGGKLV